MAKKRVYELAKDLGLSNKEMVEWLMAHGYDDVKSHSSSLEDGQAQSVTEKVLGERKPKAPPPPPTTPGFVVRRRPAVVAAPPPSPISQSPQASEGSEPPAGDATEAPQAVLNAAGQPASGAQPPAAEAQVTPQVPLPDSAIAGTSGTAAAGAPAVATVPAAPAGPVPVDPRTLRPTATQAILISRPLIPIRRVTPLSSAHKQIPMAPGARAIGEVKEFRVVSDALGRGREFIDVSKDPKGAKKRGTGRVPDKASLSKNDLMELARERSMIPIRGKKKRPTKKGKKTEITTKKASKRVIKVDETISVGELAKQLGIKASDLIRKLMQNGTMATLNHQLDVETAQVLATDYQYEVTQVGFDVTDYIDEEEVDDAADLKHRPPVVTVMGHVDHGKTSLLDAIRKADVAAGEAGGITQHIGAYQVQTAKGPITFLDTPGHAAFTAMRARGAKATDLVVLVVAADDGVMPQTIEAIDHAKAAKVPILVAINKIDKGEADIQRVKNALMQYSLVDETLGGDTIMVPVSAKTGQGVDQLLEMIALQAEVLELTANPDKPASGVIIEAKLDKGRGPVATVLVQDGTLRPGDSLVTGSIYGKIRVITNERGERIDAVLPGQPAEILGLSGVPVAGVDFDVVDDEKTAKEIGEHRELKQRQIDLSKSAKSTLQDLFAHAAKGAQKEIKLIIKGDVQGSVEAVAEALKKLATPKVSVDVIRQAVGGITESDVMLAVAAAKGLIVGFNVKPEAKAAAVASQEGIDIRLYSIIYEAVDDIKLAMEGLLEPTLREKVIGKAEVRNLFTVPKLGTIAGVAVTDGKLVRNSPVRVMRGTTPVFTGKVGSLRRFKDDVREVLSPLEAGMGIENFTDFKPGDMIEVFEVEAIRQSL